MQVTASTLWHLAAEELAPWFQTIPSAEVHITQNGWALHSGEPVADFNYTYVGDGPAAEAQLRNVSHRIQARDLSAVVLVARAVADELAPTAQALGLQPAGTIPLMVYEPADKTSSTSDGGAYSVRPVTEVAELEDVKHLLTRAFEWPPDSVDRVLTPAMLDLPGMTIFLTRRAGQPVSTVLTVTSGAIIGIWNMATLSDVQRQGAGRATLEAAIASHSMQGARLFFLCATAAGKPLYERIGFRTLEETPVWVAGHSTHALEGEKTPAG